jgi:hypothetical protein
VNRNKRRLSMDRIMRARPSSSMVVALIALFVALIGTAQAVDGPLPGQNQVGSADIIDNDVRAEDLRGDSVNTVEIRSNAVTTGKVGDGEVRTADVLNDSLTPTDIADVGFLQSDTARLSDQPGGGAASQQLFTVGRIRLLAVCQVLSNGRLLGSVQPVPTEPLNDDGPVMVLDGEGASDDFFVRLQDFDVQFVVSASDDTALDAQETSFAILHEADTSVTGVAAASVDPTTGDCVMSVQALG